MVVAPAGTAVAGPLEDGAAAYRPLLLLIGDGKAKLVDANGVIHVVPVKEEKDA
jgi:hypothetical protein